MLEEEAARLCSRHEIELGEARNEVSTWVQKSEDLEATNAALEQDVARLSSSNTSLEGHVSAYEFKAQTLEDDVVRLEKNANEKSASFAALEAQLASVIKAANSSVDRLRKDVERAEGELADANRRLQSEKELSQRSQRLLEEAIADAKNSKMRMEALERTSSGPQRSIEEEALVKELRSEMATRDDTITILRRDIGAKDVLLRERDLELRDLRKEIKARCPIEDEALVRELRREMATRDERIAHMVQDIDARDKALHELRARERDRPPIEEAALVKELRREMATRDEAIRQLRQDLDDRNASIRERDLELSALRQEVRTMAMEGKRMRDGYRDMELRIGSLSRSEERSRASADHAKKILDDTRIELAASLRENTGLMQQMRKLDLDRSALHQTADRSVRAAASANAALLSSPVVQRSLTPQFHSPAAAVSNASDVETIRALASALKSQMRENQRLHGVIGTASVLSANTSTTSAF